MNSKTLCDENLVETQHFHITESSARGKGQKGERELRGIEKGGKWWVRGDGKITV